MEKWTGELAPPPFWLVPHLEVTAADDAPKLPTWKFLCDSVDALIEAGCSFDQALEVTSNAVNETGWGRYYRAWNLGGWKITKGTSQDPDGSPRRWFRALGNKSSGDPQTCFYRAFTSLKQFYEAWLLQFVPKNGKGRYAKTGQEFWAGNPWFDDLIAAGYKGDVTRRNPDPSIRAHAKIKGSVIVFYCQDLLKITSDGKWGPKSQEACRAYQQEHGLPVTGKLDAATIESLVKVKGCEKYAKFCEDVDGSEPDSPIEPAPEKPAKAAKPDVAKAAESAAPVATKAPESPEVVVEPPPSEPVAPAKKK